MTMHAVFFKENEGVSMDGPRWTGLGSPVAAAAAVYGEAFNHSKLSCLELSAGGNNHFSAANKESEDHLITAKPNTTHFTLFSGDCKTGESREKTTLQNVSSAMDFRGHFELGFGQSLICAKYPYPDQCYGIYSTYGTQFAGRSMLPLSMSSDGGPIFVNAKQYNGIMRRRKKRAEAEMVNKMIKIRKPYLHLSRHLHAMRRPRGNGGRFLNTKTSGGETTAPKKQGYMEKQKHLQKLIKVLESDGTNSSSSRSDSPGGSDVTSDHDLFSRAFQLNNLHTTSFHHFSDVGNTALGMAMVTGNNYLKV